MCVFGGFENIGEVKGEGVQSGCRTKGRAGSLCRDLGTLVKHNKNQLCDYMTTEPARVAWLVYVRAYYVPIATLNQNKRCRFLYLGDVQIIISYCHQSHMCTIVKQSL